MRKWMMGLLALTLLTGCSSGSGDVGGNSVENSETVSEAISETETDSVIEEETEAEKLAMESLPILKSPAAMGRPTSRDKLGTIDEETECKAEEENEDLVDENTEYEPVVFTDSSDRQLTLTCTGISDSEISFIVGNDSEDTLHYGHYRRLYVENDGAWEEVELREYEEFVIAFDAGGYLLEPGEEFTEEIDIEFMWGSLESGHYKVSLEEFYFHWQDKFVVEYEFYYGYEAEDEAEESSTGYPNGQEQEIYAYYNDALYYYENLSTTSILPDDAVNVGTAIITTELPDSNLEVSCMPESTEIYYSESKNKIYLTTDGEEYWILNCMG